MLQLHGQPLQTHVLHLPSLHCPVHKRETKKDGDVKSVTFLSNTQNSIKTSELFFRPKVRCQGFLQMLPPISTTEPWPSFVSTTNRAKVHRTLQKLGENIKAALVIHEARDQITEERKPVQPQQTPGISKSLEGPFFKDFI